MFNISLKLVVIKISIILQLVTFVKQKRKSDFEPKNCSTNPLHYHLKVKYGSIYKEEKKELEKLKEEIIEII